MERPNNINASQRGTYLLIALYVFVLVFFLSTDSYIYDIWGRHDGAWFFMGGKAMMNGMIPYVDFTDSKGPLLWFIYGLGYLLSNDTYVGVFWVSLVFYIVSFIYYYKILKLVLNDSSWAIVGTFLMAIPYFYGVYHYETRAEDFCSTFVAASLYYSLLCIKDDFKTNKFVTSASISLGVAFGACLLIKFSIAIMVGVMMFTLFVLSFNKRKVFKVLFQMIFGAAIICAPFVIYLCLVGAFVPFINEYFLHTTATIQGDGSIIGSLLHDMKILLLSKKRWPCLMYVLGAFAFSLKKKEYHYFPFFAALGFVFLSSINAYWYYYLSITAGLAVFFISLIVEYLQNRFGGISQSKIAVIGSVVGVLTIVLFIHPETLFYNACGESKNHSASLLFKQVDKPKIINLGSELGIGLQAGSLPACKDWCWQAGATEEMVNSQMQSILNREADFITVSPSHVDYLHCLEEAGYVYCCDVDHHTESYRLYCRNDLENTIIPVVISKWDIISKVNVLNKNGKFN